MKKFILLMVLLAPMVGFSAGTTEVSADVSEKPLANSVVWEVTGPNIEQPSYLVGTMHMMCEKDFNISQRILDTLKKSEQLYLEMDLDDPEQQETMQNSMMAKKSLKERFSTEQYAQFAQFLEDHSQYKIEMFDQVEYIAIQAALIMETMVCLSIKMLDRELMLLAQKADKPIYGLEKAADQVKVFAVVTPEKGILMTEEEMTALIELEKYLGQMDDLYKKEDIDGLLKFMSDYPSSGKTWEDIKAVLLDDRNEKWVAKIPAIAQDKPTVFAFGSGHLAGDMGVINLLREAGLTVKPIMK